MIEEKQAAFMEAYSSCHEAFTKYCSALCYGKMNTEDLVQDILLSAYEHFDKIMQKDQLLHYLIRAARNKSVSQWRKKKYKIEFIDQHAEALKAKGLSAETQLDIQYLYRVLDCLPEKQRDAVILYEISGFSMKEIAEIQGSNEAAIKNLVSRGRRKLRNLVNQKPKSRWVIFFLGLQPLQHFSNNPQIDINQIFSKLQTSNPQLDIEEAFSMVEQSENLQKFAFQTQWMNQINLNHILMSTISLASIITIIAFVFLPGQPVKNAKDIRTNTAKPEQPIAKVEDIPQKQAQEAKITLFQADQQAELSKHPVALHPIPSLNISSLKNTPSLIAASRVNPALLQESQGLSTDCINKVKVLGNIKELKQHLLQNLIKDKLLKNRKEKMHMTFLNDQVQVNHQTLSKEAIHKYLALISQYNIKPCADRLIAITTDYIAIGDIKGDGFHGRVNGSVDFNDLNAIKLKGKTKLKSSPYQVEERPIQPFHTLQISGLAVVYLSKGETKTAKIEVSGMPIKDLIIEEKDGILSITTQGEYHDEAIKISLSTPTLKGIEVKGAAELYSKDTITADDLGVIVSESGAAWLDINTNAVHIMMNGGDLEVSGVTGKQNVLNDRDSGKGTLDVSKLVMRK